MRLFLALAAALIALVPPALTAGGPGAGGIRATPVRFDPGDPARDRVGRLRWLGGWALRSQDRRFGGFSALGVMGPGRLVAISDSAIVARLTVGHGVAGTVAPLPAAAGALKQNKDAESLAHDPSGGGWWVGYEGANAIVRYSTALDRREAEARPPAMAGWPPNGGPEAMARLPDGRLLVMAEDAPSADGGRDALLFPRDSTADGAATPLRFTYRPPPRQSPSGAATLPDGRVLVLNRGVRIGMPPFVATLTIVDPRAIRPGAVVAGTHVATLAPPLTVDNMEGVTVSREGGRTIVWLISDDNFLPFQRTLLLKFALE